MTDDPYCLASTFETPSSADAEQSVTLTGKLRTQNLHKTLGKSRHDNHTHVSRSCSSKPVCPRNHGDREHPAMPTCCSMDHLQRTWCCEVVIKSGGGTPISVQKCMNGTKQNNIHPLEANKSLPAVKSSVTESAT